MKRQSMSKKAVEKTPAKKPARKRRTSKKAIAEANESALQTQQTSIGSKPQYPVSQEHPINVVYTVNVEGEGASMFTNQLIASVASVARNAAQDDFVHVYVLYKHLPESIPQTLVNLSNGHVTVTTATFNDEDMAFMQQFTKNSPSSAVRTWSGIVFARLWIPMYLKSLDRCIYLDSDTMVRGSLRELWEFDLQGKAYGMAMGCIPEYGYNSGVMLIDCRKIDNEQNWKGLFEHMQAHAAAYMLPDQTVINRYYKDEICEMPKKFNYPPRTDTYTTDECNNALIWHFYNGGTKPSIFSEADWCKVAWNQMFKS